jgi:hypothetical protein
MLEKSRLNRSVNKGGRQPQTAYKTVQQSSTQTWYQQGEMDLSTREDGSLKLYTKQLSKEKTFITPHMDLSRQG